MSIPGWIQRRCHKNRLSLDGTLTTTELNELCAFLSSNHTNRLHTIEFEWSRSTHDGATSAAERTVEAVIQGLQQNATIDTLRMDISEHHFTESTIKGWLVELNQAHGLTTLKLWSASRSSGAIQPWLRSLQLNTTIKALKFEYCRFSPSDVKELIELLSSNYTITELVFTGHDLMDVDDFSSLCYHLKSDRFIKYLTINYLDESVRHSDATALVEMLKVNHTLTEIELDGIGTSRSIRAAFADALNYNSTIMYLDLGSKFKDDKHDELIRSRLDRNWDFVHSPLSLLLRQTELTKETDQRILIKQMKLDAYKQAESASQTKNVHQLTDEEKEEGQSAKKKSKIELPTYLSPATTQVQSTPMSVCLNEHDVEYLRVGFDFHESFAGMPIYQGLKFNVTCIERITNSVLKEQFDRSYQYFLTHDYHSNHPIRSVYHSTKARNISSIIQSNLSPEKSGSETDSGWFGRGMYFSPHADYVMMYYSTGKFKNVTVGDSGQIVQFDILPGRMLHMDDVKIGGGRTIYYDSHVSPNEFEYVMFDSRHILPRYIIHFDVVQGAGKRFQGSFEHVGPNHPQSSMKPSAPTPPTAHHPFCAHPNYGQHCPGSYSHSVSPSCLGCSAPYAPHHLYPY